MERDGRRARFSYGWSQGQDDKDILNLRDIEALHRDWKSHSNDGLITLGLGWRGKFRAGPLPESVYRTELDAARTIGIPITVHIQSRKIRQTKLENLLGKDVQLVHAVWATPDELKMVRETGATISIATTSDLRIGFGLPPVSDFLSAGIPCGVSVDTLALIGSSSLFGVMRNVRDAENARTLSAEGVVALLKAGWPAARRLLYRLPELL